MKVRLIGAALWLALFTAALLLIRDENRHASAPLLIQAADRWCDVPNDRPDTRPRGKLEPVRPFTTDQRSVA